eukprot:Awhi_evm1s10234
MPHAPYICHDCPAGTYSAAKSEKCEPCPPGSWSEPKSSQCTASYCTPSSSSPAFNGCCSTASKCNFGEGDCDKNSHCKGDLVCGYNNCQWTEGSTFDCCTRKCASDASSHSGSCCTTSDPCKIGEGDCDDDNDCEGDLVCGFNNCESEFNWGNDKSTWDCCTKKPWPFRYNPGIQYED